MKNGIRKLNESDPPSRLGFLKLAGIVAVSAVIAAVLSIWVVQKYLLPDEFKPVTLTASEEKILDGKIAYLEKMTDKHPPVSGEVSPDPEPYQENPDMRTIVFSEKEINFLLAKNTDLAGKFAIDLSDGMASAKLLLPIDEEFPVLGGKTLKVTAGVEIGYSESKPAIRVKGVSIWGVPVPNAWMGNMKNVDLVKEFGGEKGFWQSFSEGIDKIEVKEKSLLIRLNQ